MNKKKLNNKGFAISTVLYGLLVVMILLFSIIMSIMSFNRKSSKDFVETVTSELEEGLGVKINSDSNLIIDSIDNKLYQKEKYNLTYKFSIKGELNFNDDYRFSPVYGSITLGSCTMYLYAYDFNEPSYNAETNSTEFKFTKEINTNDIKKAENKFYIVMPKNWFTTPLSSDIMVNINGLSIVEEIAEPTITSETFSGGEGKATINYHIKKPGKILQSSDLSHKFSYINNNSLPSEVSSTYYSHFFQPLSTSPGEYQISVVLKDFCQSCNFDIAYCAYPISMKTNINGFEKNLSSFYLQRNAYDKNYFKKDYGTGNLDVCY